MQRSPTPHADTEALTVLSAPAVRLQLLGGFELRVNDAVVEIKPSLQRLLAMLALAGAGGPAHLRRRPAVAGRVPGTGPGQTAHHHLRLRPVPCELVRASKRHVRLGADIWVDVRDGLAEAE